MKNFTYILIVVGSFFINQSFNYWLITPTKTKTVDVTVPFFFRDTVFITKKETVFVSPKPVEKSLYKVVALHIKTQEGFRPYVYKCVAGYKTIGWGHLWSEGEPDSINKRTADILFQTDFNRKYTRSIKLMPEGDWMRHERMAFTLLTYQVSLGDFKNKGLYKALEKHLKHGKIVEVDGYKVRQSPYVDEVKAKWLKYVNYKKGDEWKSHPQFLKRRKFELSLFLLGEKFAYEQEDEVVADYMKKHNLYKEKFKEFK